MGNLYICSKLNPKFSRLTLFVLFGFVLLLGNTLNAQGIEARPNYRSHGLTKSGEFAICMSSVITNNETEARICSPQIINDLSNFPGYNSIVIDYLSGGSFDNSDLDTSASGFSSSNPSGNVIDPTTTKCLNPGESVRFAFTVFADPAVWGDYTQYLRGVSVSGTNEDTAAPLSDSATNNTPQLFDSDVILGASIAGFQSGSQLYYADNVQVNLDGTYDFSYRITLGNYDNNSNTGGTASNVVYYDELNHLYDNMPINSISVGPSANGRLTVNPNFNGGASVVGGSSVTPDNVLVTNGTLNPDETDYVEVFFNVGPIPIDQKNRGRWTAGYISAQDGFGNALPDVPATDGLDPTWGDSEGPAVTCRRGIELRFDYTADFNLTKTVINSQPAISGTPDNLDLSYRVNVVSDSGNDVNIYRLSALDSVAHSFGSNFVRIVSPPTVSNVNTSSPPSENLGFDGFNGGGYGSGVDLLSGNASNFLSPGQSFNIDYVIEVSRNVGATTDLTNNVLAVGDNALSQPFAQTEVSHTETVSAIIPEFSINDASASEGNNMTFTITSSHALGSDVNFDLAYANTTTTNSDYSGPSSVTLSSGNTSVSFDVLAVDDDWAEATNQEFTVTISDASNSGTITDGIGNGTVVDTDVAYVVGGNYDITEGGTIQYRLFLSTGTNSGGQQYVGIEDSYNIDVLFQEKPTSVSPATDGADFNGFSTTMTFPANSVAGAEIFVAVPTTDDNLVEPSEEFEGVKSYNSAELTKYGSAPRRVTINTERASMRIHDNDQAVIVLESLTVNEDVGSVNYDFTLEGNTRDAFSIDFQTVDNTATQPTDYTADSGTLNFTGTDDETFTENFTINDDTAVENLEQFQITTTYSPGTLSLANYQPQNIVFSPGDGNINIIDNDSDQDGDGIGDFADEDDDNDGILDVNEATENFDGSFLYSHNEASNPRNIEGVFPEITDWVTTNVADESYGTGISATMVGSELQFSDPGYTSFSEAFTNDGYIEYSFTTSNEIADFYLTQLWVLTFEDGGSNFDRNGDSFKAAALLSTDNFATYNLISNGVQHGEMNTPDASDAFMYLDGSIHDPVQVSPNTTYSIRFYIYDYEDDNPARNYGLWDDVIINVEGLRYRDTDNDGTPDYLDSDSDNDGCVDAIEAGHTDPDSDGILGNSPVSVGSTGRVSGQGGYTGTTGKEVVATQISVDSPPDNQIVNEGGPVNFMVTVSANNTTTFNAGTPDYSGAGSSDSSSQLSYQWQENGVNLSEGGNYNGVTTDMLTINNSSGLDGNVYTVLITHNDNNCTPISRSAILTAVDACDPVASGYADTDGDGVSDFCDLDDDNDGILDEDECIVTDSGLTGPLPFTVNVTSNDPSSQFEPHTLDAIVYSGTAYPDLLVPSGFSSSFSVNDEQRIQHIENGSVLYNYRDNPNFDNDILAAFQNRNLNSYLNLNSPNDYSDGDYYDVTYNSIIRSTDGGFVAVTERGGNNPQSIQALDFQGRPIGTRIDIGSTDYTDLGYQINPAGTQNVHMALYPIDDLVVPGTEIYGIRVSFPNTGPNDGPDARIFFFGDLTTVGCDTDGDGIPNVHDLDSDDDGCFDVIEAGYTDADNDGILGNSPVSVDNVGQVTGQGGYSGTTPEVTTAFVPVVIDTQPSDQIANIGYNVTYTSSVSGGATLSYQWQESIDSGTSWNDITNGGIYSGATTNSLTLTNITSSEHNHDYRLVITSSDNNCDTSTTNEVNLFVRPDITINNSTVPEGSVSGTDITLSHAVNQDIDFNVAYTDVSTSGGDYDTSITAITIPSGSSSFDLDVQTIDDTLIEGTERFEIQLTETTSFANCVDCEAWVDITDNDNANPGDGIAFTNITVSELEGDVAGDNTTLDFEVTYTGTIPAGETVSVDYQTVLLAAGANSADATDFTAVSGTLSFTEADKTETITVEVTEDTNIEADEAFEVLLDNITTANGFVTGFADGNTTNTATGTILNDDNANPGDGIAFTNITVSELEGDVAGDNTTLDFEVTYTGTIPAGETVSVDYQTVLLAAGANSADATDLTTISGTLSFTEADKTETITVEVTEDTNIEADEAFEVLLDNITTANGFVTGFADGNTTNTATGTILNDDNANPGDGIAFTNITVSELEGDVAGDNTTLDFEVTYTGTIPAGETVSVDYQTVLLAAGANSADATDFTAVSGTLSFTEADKTENISIEVTEDTNIEADEAFEVLLDNITTANGFVTGFADGNTTNTATGTILNDDNANPGDGIAFTNITVSELEGDVAGDNTTLDFEVTYTGTIPAGETVSVDYQTVLLAAGANSADATDLTTISGTLSFTEADKTETITVEVTEDTNIEADEAFEVLLDNITTANGFVTGFADGNTTNTATGTILNDDNANPGDGIAFTNITVSELEGDVAGDNTTLDFEVTYTGTIPAGETVSVDYQTVLLAAGANSADATDFTAVSGTLSFTEADKTETITVEVTEDTNIEADEAFEVLLDNITTANGFVTGFADGNTTNTATGTILNDDNANPGDGIAFTNITVSELEGDVAGDNTTLDFEVTYTGTIPAGETVSVDYQTVLLAAGANSADATDLTTISGTLSFTEADKTETITVEVTEDTNIEADEAFEVLLDNITTANGFVTGFADGNTTNTATGTILNDDNANPGDGIAFTNITVSELEGDVAGDNTTLDFEVTYTGTIPAGETVSVDYQTVLLAAGANSADATDLTTISGTLSFTEADKTETITVEVTEDTNIEADEAFEVLLDNITTANGFVTGFADGNTTNTATGTILNDDNANPGDGIAFTNITVSELEGDVAGDNTTLDFEVTYTGTIPAGETVSVDYQTVLLAAGANSADATDFTAVSGTLSFTEADKTETITVEVTEDTNIEADEAFEVLLDNITTANGFVTGFADGNTTNTATGTILNDDNAAPGDGIAFTNLTVSELEGDVAGDNTTLDFEVTYTGTIPAGETVSVDFQTVLLAAGANSADATDFTAVSGTLSFTEADKTETITVEVTEDTNIEADESFEVLLDNITTANGFVTGFADGDPTSNTATGTILNDDANGPTEGVAVADFTVNEDVGTVDFVISYTGNTVQNAFDVDFSITDGSATSPDDYTVAQAIGTVTFPDGTNNGDTQTVTVTIVDDVIIEPSESLDIALAFPVAVPGVNMLDADGVGTITDNDANGPTEGVAVADFTVNEDVGTVDFVISYTGNTVQNAFDVDFSITDGTAASPDDYTVAQAIGTVTFPDGTNSGDTQTVTVTIVDDLVIEPSETLDIALAFPVAVPGVNMLDGAGVGTITDNDANGPTEGVAVSDFTVNEDVGTVDFVISYTGNTVQDAFNVNFTVTDGTAINPDDYTVANTDTFVTFPDGTTNGTTQLVTINIVDDMLIEAAETLDIALAFDATPPFGVNMLDGAGVGTITDNDANGPTEGVAVSDFTVNEDVGTVDFVISYTGNTVQDAFNVNFTVTDGTAINPDDYTVANTDTFVTFPDGTTNGTTQLVTINIVDDMLIEAAETLDIALAFDATPPFGVNMLDGAGVGTITDNDANGPTEGVAVSDFTVNEDVGTVDFVISYTGNTVQDAFNVNFTVTDGTAINPDDYTVANTDTFVTFPDGTTNGTTQLVTINIVDDMLIEAAETLDIALAFDATPPFGVNMLDGAGVGTITDNDANGPTEGVAVSDFTVNEDVGTVDFVISYTGNTVQDAFNVNFTVTDGTAINPDDYGVVATNGVLIFPANTSNGDSQTITVSIVDDELSEMAETLDISLAFDATPPAGINMLDGEGLGNILDNDITSSDYMEEITILCGDEMPAVPELTFMGGCGDYDVVFTEDTIFSDDTDDYIITRTWNVTDSCGNMASFEQVIFVLQPQLEEVYIDICVEDEPIDLLTYLPEGFDSNGSFEVIQGTVELEGSTFNPLGLEVGEFRIAYSSTDGDCKYYVDFIITTNSECVPCTRDQIIVSKTVTPNGDNINDFFEIKGVEYCDITFDVMIFNRWGDKVYEMTNYQNDWGGIAPDNAVGSNGTLPAGTYYYIINVIGGDIKPLNGYIFLGVK